MATLQDRVVRALCAFRLYAGVSQEQLALNICESQPVISRIEKGKADLSIDFAPRYAKGCGGLDELDSLIEALQIVRSFVAADANGLLKGYNGSGFSSKQTARSS